MKSLIALLCLPLISLAWQPVSAQTLPEMELDHNHVLEHSPESPEILEPLFDVGDFELYTPGNYNTEIDRLGFGLPATHPDDYINAASAGTDSFPAWGLLPEPNNDEGRWIVVNFSVDIVHTSAALQNSQVSNVIYDDYVANGNVANPGVFYGSLTRWDTFPATSEVYALKGSLNPPTTVQGISDIVATTWEGGADQAMAKYVVFSPDNTLGMPSNQIYVTDPNGPPGSVTLFKSSGQLFLYQDDVIDAIAVDQHGAVLYSLTGSSPAHNGSNPPTDGATIWAVIPPNPIYGPPPAGRAANDPFVWATGGNLGLPGGADIDAAKVTDPLVNSGGNFTLPPSSGGLADAMNHSTLLVAPSMVLPFQTGGVGRRVASLPGRTFRINFDTANFATYNPADAGTNVEFALFAFLGTPPSSEALSLQIGQREVNFAFDPFDSNSPFAGNILTVMSNTIAFPADPGFVQLNSGIESGTLNMPAVPLGMDITFQALYWSQVSASGGGGTSTVFSSSNSMTVSVLN